MTVFRSWASLLGFTEQDIVSKDSSHGVPLVLYRKAGLGSCAGGSRSCAGVTSGIVCVY